MKIHIAFTALVALVAAVHAQTQLGAIDNSCQFASFSPLVLPLTPDTHRASGLTNTSAVKFLFNNQMCSDFLLCVSDSALSGGDGCAINGAKATASNICSMRGTARGDGTFMLSLEKPDCKGIDLVNCLSVNADGTAMEISQSCQAEIESLTISCTACSAPTGAVAKALAAKPICNKYGWCGKCDCPPPPPPPIPPICSAKCSGKSSCEPEDRTYVTKDDKTSCQVLDSTTCGVENNIRCTPEVTPPQPTDVDCPRFRARVELVFEKQIPTGAWVRVNEPGTTEYTTPQTQVTCPAPIINIDGRPSQRNRGVNAKQAGQVIDVKCVQSGVCTPRKSGTCAAQKTGFCACTKMGECRAKPGPFNGKLEICPEEGGEEFPPCNGWHCGKEPYPPKPMPYPPKGGAYPPKGFDNKGGDNKAKYP